MTDNDILKYFCGPKLKNIQKKKLENIPQDILNYINNRYDDSLSIREIILRIKLNIEKHPLCPYCGKPRLIHEYKSYFYPTCGNKDCIKLKFNKKFKSTMLERYGYEYNFLNKDILKKSVELAHTPENIQKSIETSTKIYGEGNCRNAIKANKTKIERYGTTSYNNSEKSKQTKIEKYGVDNPWKAESVKEKINNTFLEKYGNERWVASEEGRKNYLKLI